MKNFRINLFVRVLLLSGSLFLLFYVLRETDLTATLLILTLLVFYQIYSLIKYIDVTNKEITRFLLSIKYSDFSQTFGMKGLGSSFKDLNNAFNEVIEKFQNTRSEKEEHLKYLQTVMQHVGIGLISMEQDGKVDFINNAAKKLLRVPHLNNIGSLNKVSENLGNDLLVLKPGDRSTLKLVDDEEIIQLVMYATEFKMRNQLYKLVSLQNIQLELEEKEMEAWQKLIRVLTHEIMNSVTPISSLSQTVNRILNDHSMESKALDDETINDINSAIDSIHRRSEGLIHFVNNYRNLTKIPKPNFQIFKINQLFKSIDKLVEKEIKESGIEYKSIIEPPTLELTADPEMIEQVLINLLLNAIQSVKGIDNPQILLRAQIDDRGKIIIRVIDNGPGISEEVQEKIFIPFFSTKKDGSGIGLSLSRQIIRSHGGNIRVNSIPNKETIFTLRF